MSKLKNYLFNQIILYYYIIIIIIYIKHKYIEYMLSLNRNIEYMFMFK